jgi:hypothetical protein
LLLLEDDELELNDELLLLDDEDDELKLLELDEDELDELLLDEELRLLLDDDDEELDDERLDDDEDELLKLEDELDDPYMSYSVVHGVKLAVHSTMPLTILNSSTQPSK